MIFVSINNEIKELSDDLHRLHILMRDPDFPDLPRKEKDLLYEEYHLKLSLVQNKGKQRDYLNGKE